jgi:drug/metabolite transporter (DMT)-like permease
MAAVIDAALKTLPSSQLLFWSFVFATPAAFLWDRLLGGRPAITLFRIELPVLLIGLLGIFGWTAGVQLSLDRAPVIEANLLTYLWPLMMVAMSPLAGERFSAVSLFGVVAGFVGAALIATGGKGVAIEPGFYVGYSLALAGALAWAVFVILLQRQGSHATRRTPVFVAAGCVCAFAMAFGIDGRISIPPPMAILEAAWLGIGPMSLAFVCWDRAVTINHLALVGRLSYLDPTDFDIAADDLHGVAAHAGSMDRHDLDYPRRSAARDLDILVHVALLHGRLTARARSNSVRAEIRCNLRALSLHGTFETCRRGLTMSVDRGGPEVTGGVSNRRA